MPFVRQRCQGPNPDRTKPDEPCGGILGDIEAELVPVGLSVSLPPVPDARRARCTRCGLWTRFDREDSPTDSADADEAKSHAA